MLLMKILTGAAIIAAVMLIAASAAMNYLFTSAFGRTPIESAVLGAISFGVDVLRAILAVFIGHAAGQRRWGFVIVASFAFTLFSALSLLAAFGFSVSNRTALSGGQELLNDKVAALELSIVDVRTKLKSLPQHRSAVIVEDALVALATDPRWPASRKCTGITPATREFCAGHARLRAERVVAQEAARLE
ncbi:MAG: hypothetical protein ABL897_01405, partial [Hyphomicrobium sp.]